jgi:PKD repeat protein
MSQSDSAILNSHAVFRIFTRERRGERMRKRIADILFIFLAMSIITATIATANYVRAQSTTIAVMPSSIINTSLGPGTSLIINLTVADVTNLFTWQAQILFNPSILNCTNATYPADNIFAGKSTIPVTPLIDNVGGSVTFGCSLTGLGVFNGSGVMCQIGFNVIGRGNSTLKYSTPYGSDTFLLDTNLSVIPSMVANGFFKNFEGPIPNLPPIAAFDYSPKPATTNQTLTFNGSSSYDPDGSVVNWAWDFGEPPLASGPIVTHTYMSPGNYTVTLTVTDNNATNNSTSKVVPVYVNLPAMLYIDPANITDTTLLPPTIVTINVTVNYVTNMYDYKFKLNYNTEMLTCIGAIINRVQGQTAFTPLILIDDGAGFIWITVDYHPPAVPITTIDPLALVTVYFQVDTPGSSILHLNETELSDPAHNSMPHETADGFIRTLIRDVEITDVTRSTSWAYQGWPVDISVTAKNNGNISESFDVKAYYDSNLIGTIPIVNLPSTGEQTVIFHWDTTGVAEGNYTISAEATFVPFEFNVTNNYLSDGKVQIFTAIRDVAITGVTTSRNWVYPGVPVNISVTAKNLGDVTESFDIKVYYDSNLLATRSIIDLPSKAETTEVFSWDTSGLVPCNNYTISAVATFVPFEYNTTNNVFTDGFVKIRHVGDINGDGKVDMKDIALVAAAFGTSPGHPRWNPDADITGPIYLVPDSKIDMRDVSLVAKNFGQGC